MKATMINPEKQGRNGESGHVPFLDEIFDIPIADIKPAIINDQIYGVTDPDDPKLDDLIRRLHAQGQLEPVVLSLDGVLIAGHRRLAAATYLGWKTLKARRHPIYSTDPNFEKVLVTFNEQRDKTPDVRIREQIVLTDAERVYEHLVSERAKASRVKVETLSLGVGRKRAGISQAK